MFLLANIVRIPNMTYKFVVELVGRFNGKYVNMISGRNRFNFYEAIRIGGFCHDQMAAQRILARHQCGKPHPALDRDPGFLRDYCNWPTFPN